MPERSLVIRSFELADLDGDRRADLVFHMEDGIHSSPPTVARSVGDGTFEVAAIELVINQPYAGLAIADVDHDGQPDLVSDTLDTVAQSGRVDVFRGLGGTTFAPPIGSASFRTLGRLTLVDLDRDGNLDVVGESEVGFGKGDGSFGRIRGYPISQGVADLDGDGLLDVIDKAIVGRQLACP